MHPQQCQVNEALSHWCVFEGGIIVQSRPACVTKSRSLREACSHKSWHLRTSVSASFVLDILELARRRKLKELFGIKTRTTMFGISCISEYPLSGQCYGSICVLKLYLYWTQVVVTWSRHDFQCVRWQHVRWNFEGVNWHQILFTLSVFVCFRARNMILSVMNQTLGDLTTVLSHVRVCHSRFCIDSPPLWGISARPRSSWLWEKIRYDVEISRLCSVMFGYVICHHINIYLWWSVPQ